MVISLTMDRLKHEAAFSNNASDENRSKSTNGLRDVRIQNWDTHIKRQTDKQTDRHTDYGQLMS